MITVLIADDHPVVRSGLHALLSSLNGFDVVALAADGRQAMKEAVLHKPDVALMDLHMPRMDGFTAIRELARSAPDVAVCVLTMFEDDDSLFAAMRAGARGYLLKGAEQEDIARGEGHRRGRGGLRTRGRAPGPRPAHPPAGSRLPVPPIDRASVRCWTCSRRAYRARASGRGCTWRPRP